MYRIDREKNQTIALTPMTFAELKFKERQHLQEWIDKNPGMLGEDLLILQKEFHGFSDTQERLDLLALDKQGNLVIIENKLDDSGRDMVWQALKYASYCASLSKHEIRDIYQEYLNDKDSRVTAEEQITSFMDQDDFDGLQMNVDNEQRIILVAAKFRKEVTTTVLWMREHGIDVRCIKVTPYQNGSDLFLDTEQILPPPDVEELQIKLYKKKQEEISISKSNDAGAERCRAFWEYAIPILRKTTNLFHAVSPSTYSSAGASINGIGYYCVAAKRWTRAEIYIDRTNFAEDKIIFDRLFERKQELEEKAGCPLAWDRLDDKRVCRISISDNTIGTMQEDKWDEVVRFLGKNIMALRSAFEKPIDEIIKTL